MSHAIPPDSKKDLKKAEESIWAEDRELLDIKKAKYDLESYTYEMKNGLDAYGNYESYIDASIKDKFMATLQETQDWIYSEGESAPLEQQREKLANLKTIGEPVKTRYRFRMDQDEWIGLFNKLKNKTGEKIPTVAHLTDEQKNTVAQKIMDHEVWFTEIASALESTPKHVDLPYTLAMLEDRHYKTEKECWDIINSSPPAPKKPEPKEETKEENKEEGKAEDKDESKPAAGADAEMKDEATM